MTATRRTMTIPGAPAPVVTPTQTATELVDEIFRLRNAGRQMEAEPLIATVLNDADHAARQDPNFWRALAIWSADAHHHESVRDAYREIIKLGADLPQPWEEYAKSLDVCGDYADALEAARLALDLCDVHKLHPHDPTRFSILVLLGSLYQRFGKPTRAKTYWRQALAMDGTLPLSMSFQVGQIKMLLDNDIRAWQLHEARLTTVALYRWEAWHAPAHRRWYPGLKGRVVFWQEQGAGDLLMMARYIPQIAASSGEDVVVRCDPHLWSVMQEVPGVAAVVGRTDEVDADYELPILSAPFAFRVNGWSDLPPPVIIPSLAWTRPTADVPMLGVCWAGTPQHHNDRDRSMPVKHLPHLHAAFGRYRLQSLQPGPCPDWMAPLPSGDYLDTARVLAECHALWSVDTSVVHLAQTMGCPTVMVPPASSEWRWGLGAASPWYPDLHMVKRRDVHDWYGAIARSNTVLRHLT